MSWIDKVRTDYIITTGDGRSYFPEWLNAIKQKEFNVSEFEFPELKGTLVKRTKPKGRKFNIEIYFQGENHLDTAEEFEQSSEDERFWTIQHPFYGQLFCHPLSLTFDNKDLNLTKITGVIAETIISNPQTKIDSADAVFYQSQFTLTRISDVWVSIVPSLKTKDIRKMSTDITLLKDSTKGKILDKINAEDYFNLFNQASSLLDNITSEPLAALYAIQSFINAPVFFADTVINRMNLIIAQIELLRAQIDNFVTPNDKKIFESETSMLMASLAQTTVVNYSYSSRDEVYLVMENLLAQYDQYIEDLDGIQSDSNNSPDSYVPDADSMTKLSILINYVVTNLINIATSAKQERSLFLESDSNIVLLVHRFYGIDPDDAMIEKFVMDNKIALDEYLVVSKGRKITWFV